MLAAYRLSRPRSTFHRPLLFYFLLAQPIDDGFGAAGLGRVVPNEKPDQDIRVEGDAYDFTRSEECGMSVGSCVGRCQNHVWRIKVSGSCADTQPGFCCPE